MAKVICYPIGNADCTLIEFDDEKRLLVDFCHRDGTDDKRVDLAAELRARLGKPPALDYVAFTHADDDHCAGADEFFHFDHAKSRQGGDRVVMRELWVPANYITEEGLEDAARCIRQEARYRLEQRGRVRVFGHTDKLDGWLAAKKITWKEVAHLFTTAGSFVPGFCPENSDPAHVFLHSPFSFLAEEDDTERNNNSLVFQVTFQPDSRPCRLLLGADAEHELWEQIITTTLRNDNDERLMWDAFRVSHHASYGCLAASRDDKVVEGIDRLFREFGQQCGRLIASCRLPVSSKTDNDPPHQEAVSYYQGVAEEMGGKGNFIMTMKWPSAEKPQPYCLMTTPQGFVECSQPGTARGGSSPVSVEPRRFGR